MLAMKGLMNGGDGIDWVDVFNGFDLNSTFTGGPTYVKDYLDTLVKVPYGTRAIEGGELSYDEADGAYLGAELVVNGDFTSATGWGVEAGWSISGGQAFNTSSNRLFRAITTNVGSLYRATYDVVSITSGSIAIQVTNGKFGQTVTTAGTYTDDISPIGGASNVYFDAVPAGSSCTCTIDNVSVKEIIPVWLPTNLNPAYMINGVAKYGSTFKGYLNEPSRQNSFLQSKNLTASWTLSGTTTPDATTLLETATTATHVCYQNNAVGTYTRWAKVKGIGRNRAMLSLQNVGFYAVFDFPTVSVIEVSSGATATIVQDGDYYKISITATTTATGASSLYSMGDTSTFATRSFLGDITKGLDVQHQQLEAGSFLTSQIDTTTAAVTRPASVLSRPWPSGLVNNFGVWGRVRNNGAGQTTTILSTYVDASNYFIITWVSATIIRLTKRIAGTNYSLSITTTQVEGEFVEFMAYQDSDVGMGFAYKKDGGSWSAWAESVDANGKANAPVASTYSLGNLASSGFFAGNFPFLGILRSATPKADLEKAATLYG